MPRHASEITKAKSFSEIQEHLNKLYGAQNAKRGWDYLFGYLSRSCGFMSVNASKGLSSPENYVRAMSWLFALGNALGIDITNEYVKRFPRKCYYCLTAPCVCHRTQKRPLNGVAAYKVDEEREYHYQAIKTAIDYEDVLIDHNWVCINVQTIYPNNEIIWFHAGPWYHFTKLSEEVAELHQAISKLEARDGTKENVVAELADVFAWIVAVWILAFPGHNIQNEIIDTYRNGCPVCRQYPCTCPARNERRVGITSIAELQELHQKVEALSAILTDRHSELSDIKISLERAIKTKDEQVAVQAVIQTKDTMDAIKTSINKFDEASKKVGSIVETAYSVINKLLSVIEMTRPFF